ncbi:MAG: DEAD/DEAH box helicase [bacterium]
MAHVRKKFAFHPAVESWFNSQFSEPSPPQEQGWPKIAAGEHTLILAPTGSGKTLAAFLWCIDDIFRSQVQAKTGSANAAGHRKPGRFAGNGVHTLYISPLKALNNDIHRNLQEPLKGIRRQARKLGLAPPEIRALVRTGDTPSHVRQSMVKKPPHILITTPESLYLLLTSERGREIFRDLQYLIVDEIHAIANSKRGVHLSLSLERLMPLCRAEPVRIGLSATQRPLQRIAAFLGGQTFPEKCGSARPRPVTLVDCGRRKPCDLQVLSPVEDFGDLPEATVWPAVVEKLYDLICAHRTTLIFVNMRAQSERVARQLNELHAKVTGQQDAEIALAHHGSISREVRYDIEARLKDGEIPAVIATASLELGIDIGNIDLVVQLAAPRTVSGGLQRVGRSGHLLSATSKGRILPLFQSDLDDAVGIAQLMVAGEIEETVIPENCLDVLAQQIVAEVAMRDWPREALYRQVTQSTCYRNLSVDAFDQVVEMVAGRFAEMPFRALQPRISWDRVNDRLIALPGARLLATMNGGTIPDRGYYAVYLKESNVRLGEMEEEFVFESRVGHVFFLGNNEWRIDDIKQDRIVVSPVRTVKPRAPFWKGDLLYRDFETSQKIGAFRQRFPGESETGSGVSEQRQALSYSTKGSQSQKNELDSVSDLADPATVSNLMSYLKRQEEATGALPSNRLVVGEWFRDSADEPHLILHTCFGARVNGLWAIGLCAALEKKFAAQVQYTYDDDGLLIRVLDTTEPPPVETLLSFTTTEMEELLVAALIDTPVFAVHFRYNAARALILPRSRPNKRIPLWLQRLRAADLLQVVRQIPDFPIVAETLRDCLQNVFDWRGLQKVLDGLLSGEIRTHFVHTRVPSPMASGLMFDFLSENIYETDRSRLPGQVAAVSSELLAQILNKEAIPAIVTAEIVQAAEARWQHLTPETQARTAEELFAIIEKLAPVQEQELAGRSRQDPADWLQQLFTQNRIVGGPEAIVPCDGLGTPTEKVRRFLRVRGPRTFAQIKQRLQLSEQQLQPILATLHAEKEVVRGRLLHDGEDESWCDRHNFAQLYRQAVAQRRQFTQPATRTQWLSFQLLWHKTSLPGQSLHELVRRYTAFAFPVAMFEREILRSRFCGDQVDSLPKRIAEFENGVSSGDYIVRAHREFADSRIRLSLMVRGAGSLFCDKAVLAAVANDLRGEPATVYAFLRENGASFLRDITSGARLSPVQAQQALSRLAKSGLVSSESYPAFLKILQADPTPGAQQSAAAWLPTPLPDWTHSRRSARSRRNRQEMVRARVHHGDSRWFLTASFGVLGNALTHKERAERQARLLLQRYGILVKEWYRREQGLLPWYELFQVLKRLEWQGEIRRGYFISGLSGVQFALPRAVELVESIQTGQQKTSTQPVLLCTLDPALPLGGTIAWDLHDMHGHRVNVTRAPANHFVFQQARPVFYSENYGARLWRLAKIPQETLDACVSLLKTWLRLPTELRPRKRLEIARINCQPAAECQLAEVFVRNGFEREGEKLLLWPSGV